MLRRTTAQKRETPVKTKKQHARLPAPRTAPLFDGVPEPGSENYTADDQQTSVHKKKPRTPVFASTVASRTSNEPAMAIFIPGVLGLVGFLLAGTTVVRRRRTR